MKKQRDFSPESVQQWLEQYKQYAQYAVQKARQEGVDPADVLSIMMTETKGTADPVHAVSKAGAQGIMQLMPKTSAHYGIDPFDPYQNIDAGIAEIKQNSTILKRKGITAPGALYAAYNAGIGAVQRYNGIPPYEESRGHVKSSAKYRNALTTVMPSLFSNSSSTGFNTVNGGIAGTASSTSQQVNQGVRDALSSATSAAQDKANVQSALASNLQQLYDAKGQPVDTAAYVQQITNALNTNLNDVTALTNKNNAEILAAESKSRNIAQGLLGRYNYDPTNPDSVSSKVTQSSVDLARRLPATQAAEAALDDAGLFNNPAGFFLKTFQGNTYRSGRKILEDKIRTNTAVNNSIYSDINTQIAAARDAYVPDVNVLKEVGASQLDLAKLRTNTSIDLAKLPLEAAKIKNDEYATQVSAATAVANAQTRAAEARILAANAEQQQARLPIIQAQDTATLLEQQNKANANKVQLDVTNANPELAYSTAYNSQQAARQQAENSYLKSVQDNNVLTSGLADAVLQLDKLDTQLKIQQTTGQLSTAESVNRANAYTAALNEAKAKFGADNVDQQLQLLHANQQEALRVAQSQAATAQDRTATDILTSHTNADKARASAALQPALSTLNADKVAVDQAKVDRAKATQELDAQAAQLEAEQRVADAKLARETSEDKASTAKAQAALDKKVAQTNLENLPAQLQTLVHEINLKAKDTEKAVKQVVELQEGYKAVGGEGTVPELLAKRPDLADKLRKAAVGKPTGDNPMDASVTLQESGLLDNNAKYPFISRTAAIIQDKTHRQFNVAGAASVKENKAMAGSVDVTRLQSDLARGSWSGKTAEASLRAPDSPYSLKDTATLSEFVKSSSSNGGAGLKYLDIWAAANANGKLDSARSLSDVTEAILYGHDAASGPINVEDYAEAIQQYFAVGVQVNNELSGFQALGVPKQRLEDTTVKDDAFVTGIGDVNVTSLPDIKRYLSHRLKGSVRLWKRAGFYEQYK